MVLLPAYVLASVVNFLSSPVSQHCYGTQFVLNALFLMEMDNGLFFMKGLDIHPEVGLQPHHLCKIVGTPKRLMHTK